MRGAGGVFLQKPGNTSFGQEYWRIGNNTGLFDYQFNQALLGRSEVNGLFAHQLLVGDAQFHVINYSLYTDSWFTSTNLQTTLPGVIPVRLYADIAAINNRTLLTTATASGQTTTIQYNTELLYTGGICVYLFGGIFQVHVPMFASQQITEFWYQNNIKFQERINFTLHLDELNLYRIIQGLKM
jgi:hypothetical protein